MDTIAINANDVPNEGQETKKIKVSDKAKAAMTTGIAGVAAGVAGMSVAEAMTNDEDKNEQSTASHTDSSSQETEAQTQVVEDVITEVNPDDVMLEEPVANQASETDLIAESQPLPQSDEAEVYEPFANNNEINGDIIPEPQPEDVLLAENSEFDAVIGSDSDVDLICGLPQIEQEENGMPDEIVGAENDFLANNEYEAGEYDVQSDLMA